MANAKYAQVPSMAGSGQLNWRTDRIVALLTKNATFNTAHTRFSETGGTQISVAEIEGRSMGTAGEAIGLPASFSRIAKNQPYQVLVVKDVGDNNPMLIAFYNVDSTDGPVQMTNNGTLIVRPVQANVEPPLPPTLGIWFVL
jgi:hypothetical protein